jgi:hypothetical protein
MLQHVNNRHQRMVITKDDVAQFFAIEVASLQPDLHSAHAQAAASAMFDSQPAEGQWQPFALYLLQCTHVRSTPTPSALRAAIATIACIPARPTCISPTSF